MSVAQGDQSTRTETAERAAESAPGQILERARAEYAAGRLTEVVRLLEPKEQTTAALGEIPGDTATQARVRSEASAAALLARAAARTGAGEAANKALGHAVSLFGALRAAGIELSVDELSDAAIAFFSANRFDDASEAMRAAVAQGASSAETYLFLGLIEAQLGHADKAVDALSQAAMVEGDDLQQRRLEALGAALRQLNRAEEAASAYFGLGNRHYQLGRYEEALSALEQAIALDPRHAQALATKGELLRLLGDPTSYDEALAAVEKALLLEPDFAWGHAVHGELLRAMDRLEPAAKAYERAVELDSSIGQWYYRHGEVLRLLGRFEVALKSFERSLELEPDVPSTIARCGEVLRVLNRLPEALAKLDAALEKTPEKTADEAWILASKGETLRGLGKLPEAEEILQRVLKMSPEGYPFAETALGHLWLDRDRDHDALTMFERALEGSPTYAWALEGKAHALLQLDRVGEGLEVTRRLIELQPESAWAHGVAGVLLYKTEDYAASLLELERGVEQDATVDWVQNALATCCTTLSRAEGRTDSEALLDKAIAASTTATRINPDDISWRATLAEALWAFKGARRQEAIGECRKVLEAARRQEKLDYYRALDAGWAAFRLASSDASEASELLVEAQRLTVESLTQKSDRPWSSNAIAAKFNLAVMMLCSERFALALREYDGAVTLAAKAHDPGLRRGLLGRARLQLADALADWPRLQHATHVQKVLTTLDTAYAAQASPASNGS